MPDFKLIEIKKCLEKVKELSDPTNNERQNVLSQWKREGEYPFQLIRLQFDILKLYFDSSNSTCSVAKDSRFLNLLHTFIKALSACFIKDARFFYSQTLSVRDKEICMYDLLKHISEERAENIKYQMELFALFLVTHNPSCVVQSRGLESIYKMTHVGPGFSRQYFINTVLPDLYEKASAAILDKLKAFSSHVKERSVFSSEDIAELKAIYALRWSEIAGGKRDYTRNQQGVNASWIMVARLLSGAGIFPVDYYNVLMPTLEHTHNTYTRERLVHYPLSHYILSEKGRRLILLDTCAAHYQHQKIEPRRFCNASVCPIVDFTAIERSRIRFAAPRFHHFTNVFDNENNSKEELPLKSSTIQLVAKLLEASLEDGITEDDLGAVYAVFDESLDSLSGDCRARVLTSTPRVEDIVNVLSSREVLIIRCADSYEIGFCNSSGDYQQKVIDDLAIRDFLRPYEGGDFVTYRGHKDKLNEILTSFGCRTRIDEERLRFLYHRIKFGAFDLNPKYILGQIAFGQDPDITVSVGCVREYCNNFAQLVMNYSIKPSDFGFPPRIEEMISTHSMRERATKMVFSDALCYQGEKIDRNLLLLFSLLTYRFPRSSEETYTMSFLNYENTTSDSIVRCIFERLTEEFEGSLVNPSHKPKDIMDEVVLPFIAEGGVTGLPLETQIWFKLIRTRDFFSNKCDFYDSKHLFLSLTRLGSYTHAFLDEMLQIMQQPEDASIHMLCINIKFLSFLSTLNEEQRGEVFKSLSDTRCEVTYSDFFRSVYRFITSRISVEDSSSSDSTWLSTIFGRKPTHAFLSDKLKRKEDEQIWDSFISVDGVLNFIQEVVDGTPNVALPPMKCLLPQSSGAPVVNGGARCYSSRTNSSNSSINGMTPRATFGSAVQSPNLTYGSGPGELSPSITLCK